METTGVTKTTAVMNVRTNVIATIWYAIALNGTTPPTLDHIMNNVPPSLTTPRIVYGMAYSYDGDIDINLNNLEAETTYSVYVYAMDRLGRTTKHPTIRFFTTIERY